MVSRRRSGGIVPLILLGVFGGVIFLVFSGALSGGDSEPAAPEIVGVGQVAPPEVEAAAQPEAVEQVEQQPETMQEPEAAAEPTVNDGTFGALVDARILIPTLAVNAPVIQAYLEGGTWDVSNLGTNVGHLQGTTWMGEIPGNIVLSGHVEMADGRQGVFSDLKDLQVGDPIIIQQGDEERRYTVVEISNVEPTDLTPVRPTVDERLTLITCDVYDFFLDSYQERTVVIAEPFDF